MQLKMNRVVAGLAGVFIIGVGMISLKGRESSEDKDTAPVTQVNAITPETLREMGLEGDTPQDTLKTLVGKIQSIDKRQVDHEKALETKEQENQRLRAEQEKVPSRIASAVDAVKTKTNEQIARLESELGKLKNREPAPAAPATSDSGFRGADETEMPVGRGQRPSQDATTAPEPDSQGMLWVEPLDVLQTDRNGNILPAGAGAQNQNSQGTMTFPTLFSETAERLDNAAQKTKSSLDGSVTGKEARSGIPFWTLPENSTLMGSVAMTALIGRVPIDGNVTDPFPFKVIIGPDNLTANGIDLPNVEAAIISGTASGDWVLSCVRGTLTSFTLVFSDGRIRTLSGGKKQGDSNGGNGSTQGIGWLSDDNGIPCVSGERKTNAGTYLPTLFALSGVEAAAESMATAQTTTTTGDTVISTLSGSAGQYTLAKGLAGGTSAAAEWFRKRYGQMFDAVYVRPGANVAIHISQQLEIDYEEDGRLVNYGRSLGSDDEYGLD